jgi:hypothetical protein
VIPQQDGIRQAFVVGKRKEIRPPRHIDYQRERKKVQGSVLEPLVGLNFHDDKISISFEIFGCPSLSPPGSACPDLSGGGGVGFTHGHLAAPSCDRIYIRLSFHYGVKGSNNSSVF